MLSAIIVWQNQKLYGQTQCGDQMGKREYNILKDQALEQYSRGELKKSYDIFINASACNYAKQNPDSIDSYGDIIGYLAYNNGDLEVSFEFYHKFVNYCLRSGSKPEAQCRGLLACVSVLYFDSKYFLSFSYCKRAWDIVEQNNLTGRIKQDVLFYLGSLYYAFGDYENALRYLLLSIGLADSNMEQSTTLYGVACKNAGNAFFMQKDYEKAIEYSQKAFDANSMDRKLQDEITGVLAMSYAGLHNYTKAEKLFKKVLVGEENDGYSENCLNYANFLMDRNEYSDAREWYEKNLKIRLKGKQAKRGSISRSLYFLGKYWLKCQQPDSALRCFQQAMIVLCPGFHSTDYMMNPELNSTPLIRHLLAILDKKGATLKMMAKTDKSQEKKWLWYSCRTYSLAIRLLNITFRNYQADNSRLFLSHTESHIYTDAANSAYELAICTGNPLWKMAAFNFADAGKAQAMLSALSGSDLLQNKYLPFWACRVKEWIDNGIALREYQLSSLSEDVSGKDEVNQIRQELVRLYDWKEEFTKSLSYDILEEDWKENSQIHFTSLSNRTLNSESAFLEYSCADSTILIFAANNYTSEIYRVKVDTSFYSELRLFQAMTNTIGRNSDKMDSRFIRAGMQMYRYLIAPCEKILANKSRLIICLDPIMGDLAFEAFVLPDKNDSFISVIDYRMPDYLLNHYATSYIPSAAWLYRPKNKTVDDLKLTAFAPDYSTDRDEKSGFPPDLPGARKEAEEIVQLWSGELLTDSGASIKNFSDIAGNSGVLHLAMHSFVDVNHPLASGLIFMSSRGPDTLSAGSIYSMHIKSEMVVLNCCNSGTGKMIKGEGMHSLSRAFLYAGCRSVIMTTHPIDDMAGSDIMKTFYRYLANGFPRDIALQKAKLDFISGAGAINAHPAVWSTYKLIGDNAIVAKGAPIKGSLVIICCLSAILISTGFVVIIRRRKKILKRITF